MPLRLPPSIRKYIRREKARIRRSVADSAERERRVAALYAQYAEYGHRRAAKR